MNFFICQEWGSTKGNHTGISHLCHLIKDNYQAEVEVINVPYLKGKYLKHTRPIYHMLYFLLSVRLLFQIKSGDKVYLMEYMFPYRNQKLIAKIIKMFKKGVKIYGLAHLTPIDMDRFFPTRCAFLAWTNMVDVVITLGSSLTSYLRTRGAENVITSFHYVDQGYYSSRVELHNGRLKAIIMGQMQRKTDDLEYVVKSCPEIDFIYCKGKSTKDTSYLEQYPNMEILGYIPEEKLRNKMKESDISLNIMYDTVGSNVITTSLAMGLVMIVSDVGSIRDYCKEDAAFFCKTTEDFIHSLQYCSSHQDKLLSYKEKSIQMARNLSFRKFYEHLNTLD